MPTRMSGFEPFWAEAAPPQPASADAVIAAPAPSARNRAGCSLIPVCSFLGREYSLARRPTAAWPGASTGQSGITGEGRYKTASQWLTILHLWVDKSGRRQT